VKIGKKTKYSFVVVRKVFRLVQCCQQFREPNMMRVAAIPTVESSLEEKEEEELVFLFQNVQAHPL
jgi:hypothetical protein